MNTDAEARQSLHGRADIVLRTAEMRSDSYSEGFQINADRQIRTLAYLYSSRPRQTVSDRSTPHDAGVVLDAIEKPHRKLTGRYWTERHTTGEMEFAFGSDDLLEEMPEDSPPHPASSRPNRREHLVAQREAFGRDDQRDDHLAAVASLVAAVAVLAQIMFAALYVALEVGARQVVQQHVELRPEQLAPAPAQELEQFSLCAASLSRQRYSVFFSG